MKPVRKGFHRHHVIPKHAGGTDDDDNIVYLTVDEHIQAHLDLYKKYGREADKDAASFLRANKYRENSVVKQLLHRRSCQRGARAAHEVKLENGFYQKLGQIVSEKLTGRSRPDLAAAKKQEWADKQWKWYNNGIENRRLTECPDGWIAGRLPMMRKDARPKTIEKYNRFKGDRIKW